MNNPTRVHYIQHVPFEDLGYIATWLTTQERFAISSTKTYLNNPLPNTSEFDWLIVMGGTMSVNDEQVHSWLKPEKQLIKKAIEEGKVVLGICLGAQLIASAMGAKVYPNQHKEIGWWPVSHSLPAGTSTDAVQEAIVFQWHGDTFELPHGAKRVATSEACLNQAFTIGSKVLALQFHLEATTDGITQLYNSCKTEIAEEMYIQQPEMLIDAQKITASNSLMNDILQNLPSQI